MFNLNFVISASVELPICPQFVQGDGMDENGSTGNEINLGPISNPEDCIKTCQNNTDASVNGVTIRVNDNFCRCMPDSF